jgi:protein involved in polysaccharide export with SLBB domain
VSDRAKLYPASAINEVAVMRMSFRAKSVFGLLSLLLLCWPVLAPSQAMDPSRERPNGSNSRAEREAEDLVSLSADKILEIFRDSPGLVLAFKRTLVRKAYEQGRLLDPESLTDDTVFNLIRTDAHTRVLATQEIEKRSYVRAKPTDEELAAGRNSNNRDDLAKSTVSEKDYWKQRADLGANQDRERRNLDTPPQQSPTAPSPATPSVPTDRRREMLRAKAAQGDIDYPSLTPIGPADLPSVLSASDLSSGLSGSGGATSAAQKLRENPGLAAASGLGGVPAVNSDVPPETASLSAPRQQIPGIQPNYAPPVMRHRPNPYADVPSLYDLYSQVSRRSPALDRFGMDIFTNGTGNLDELPMDLPAGPDYILGPGDTLKIDLWGSISQRLQRVVDREGRVSLPEAGAVQVTGKTLGAVQELVQGVLRTQYRDVRADVALARIRTVRVYVVGDVVRPGAYDISALSTPLNAVFAAGGPSSRGSLRIVKQFRGKQLVQESDLYDLILHGVRSDMSVMQSGDTIQVPPIGPQITVEGMVRRPAIYELHGESNLAEALEVAGGVLSTGTLRHINVERVQAHDKKVMLSLDLPETNDQHATTTAMENFKIQDGDVIRIAPILPYSYKTVYLDGHVFHPGKYSYSDGMKVTDLIKSYADMLPEPSRRHAEIIRLDPPDYRPVVLAFNLEDALSGKGSVPALKPFDTVRIFGRYDFEDAPEVMVSGEVRDPGEHLTNGETHLRDAIYLAGGVTTDAKLDDAQIYRKLPDGEVKVLSVNLGRALAGDPKDDVLLEAKDRIIIHRDLTKIDPPTVSIQGQVAKPGRYPLGSNMSAADLVRLAGGFKRGAFTASADLSRYVVENGTRILGEHQEIPIGKAMAGEPDSDVRLMDGDILSIRELAGWKEVGASITISGEVQHAGVYGIEEGEKLSSLIERAGGFTATSYPYGAVLERAQVREFSEKSRQEMIHRIESGGTTNISGSVTGQEQAALLQASIQQQQQVLTSLKNQSANGRLVIHISQDVARWKNTAADIEMRAGDVLIIPKRPNFVIVSGQVYNSSAVSYAPGKSASWYLQQAGGATALADKGKMYVIRADGSVVGHDGGGSSWWHGSVQSLKLQPGDTVVVPERFITGSSAWKEILSAAQFASTLAIAARVATSF